MPEPVTVAVTGFFGFRGDRFDHRGLHRDDAKFIRPPLIYEVESADNGNDNGLGLGRLRLVPQRVGRSPLWRVFIEVCACGFTPRLGSCHASGSVRLHDNVNGSYKTLTN